MAMKAVINYPETEEGMREFKERQAEAVISFLKAVITPIELDMLIDELRERVKNKSNLN